MGCMLLYLWDVYLVCCKIDWRQLDFSWAYTFTERDSKESEDIQISEIDVGGGLRTGHRSPTQCAERFE